jgi:hypothetical protein
VGDQGKRSRERERQSDGGEPQAPVRLHALRAAPGGGEDSADLERLSVGRWRERLVELLQVPL